MGRYYQRRLRQSSQAVRRQAVTDPRLSVQCNSFPPVCFQSDIVFNCMIKNIDTLLGQDKHLYCGGIELLKTQILIFGRQVRQMLGAFSLAECRLWVSRMGGKHNPS